MSERGTTGRAADGAADGGGDPTGPAYFADHVLRAISDAVLCTDARGVVTFVNPAACTLLRCESLALLGNRADEVFTLLTATLEPLPHPIVAVLASGQAARVPPGTILVRRDGGELAIEDCTAPIRAADGALAGAVMVFHDVTEAHQTMLRMTHQATHDFLTDLPNRALLGSRLAHEVALAARRDTGLAVLYLDLDNFKHVNDSLGHGAGDRLLTSVATRLRECVRRSDTVSRFGGDEFVVLLTLADDAAHMAGITASKILARLALPHEVDGNTLHTSASIGIAICPEDGADAETLVRNADTALYLAKDAGKNAFRFFEPHMNEEAVQRQQLQGGLRAALANGELRLHYQPKFDLRSGRLTGSEALVRWHHPVWGAVPPSRFVTIAEDFGLIGALGRWVRDTACAQLVAWQRAGMAPGHAAVNVSARELHDANFEAGLVQTLRDTGIAPEQLQLEITEGVLLHDTDAALAKLRRVRDMGVRLAIDDFGTGYSSLSYLRRLPVDTIKIDQSFVRAIGAEAAGAAIVRAVIGLGQTLGRRIVAEGVEAPDQLDFLRRQDCDEAQGYWFSAPLPAAEYAARWGLAPHGD
ncbi:bifunctional diguanylate cyclase/phosphodiesterase [Massilia sp. YMA4]|uniref:putative bifunctional diguanylate cyclase/phosphodiesterase n=1 Tax=Massilia sp. YMA4 TaxID=1593482 RepID=UPI000DD1280D|nr:GGDEF and EAL domain-containing protein [Massilia sp. YMA4]AXA90659.1 two-component system response regulator [Massilia sp. YMA4]